MHICFCLRNNSVSCSGCVCVYMWERGLVCGNSDWNLVSVDRLYCCIQNPRDKIDSETTESTFEYRFNIVEVFSKGLLFVTT